jgi:predicted O-linked N-acetylglucosamine transferase (SPINDLY family)
MYQCAGGVEGAVDAFRQALAIKPSPAAYADLLYCLNFDERATPAEIYRQHVAWGELYPTKPGGEYRNSRSAARVLKIGFVSSGFRRHTTYCFFAPLLEGHATQGHDKPAVHVTCYDNTAAPDDFSTRLRSWASEWRTIRGMTDEQTAALIREDCIDILVDLSGHTIDNRLPLFALKPAPVQVTYLGYPNTTGLPAMDYRITDALADPPGMTEMLHAEKLIRLPRCFVAYRSPLDSIEVSPSPAVRNGYVTFGSFSTPLKWNDTVLDCWAAILRRVPGSQLLLHHAGCSHQFPAVFDALEAKVFERFSAAGVDRSRVRILGKMNEEEHHALYRQIDISLDPFPYNGTTAICESLWMGVPVVGLTGDTHVSRVTTSILSSLGLENWVVPAMDQYVVLAASAAGDLAALSALRVGLRQRMLESPVTDGHGLARAMEGAYRKIWRDWCEGVHAPAKCIAAVAAGV